MKKVNKTENKIFTNLLWKFGERLLAQGISFAVSVILARLLLPSDYGIVSLVMIFIIIADVFVTSGFSTALIQKKDATEIDFSTIFYCSLTLSVILYLSLYALAPMIADFYNSPSLTLILRVIALRLPLSAYNSIQHAYVSRHMLFKKFFYSTLLGTIASGIVGISLALLGKGVWALVWQYLANTIVDSMVLGVTIKWRPRRLFSAVAAKSLMKYGWKILVADLSGVFFDQLRGLLIGKVYTPSDLAYYNRGQSFSSLILDNISMSIMTVLFPALSNLSDNVKDVKETVSYAVKMMSFIIFPVIGGIIIMARPIVYLLLSEKWISSIPYMQILSLAAGVGLMGNVSLQSIKAIGRSEIVLKLEGIKKPVYLLVLIWGMRHGVLGVAWSMLIYAVYSVITNTYPLKKTIQYGYKEQFNDIKEALGMTVAMLGAVGVYNAFEFDYATLLFLQVVTGGIVYLGLAHLFNVAAYRVIIGYIIKNIKRI